MQRTVVLHPGALGDVLLAIPALRALRAGTPVAARSAGTPVVLAAQPRIGRLLQALDVVDDALDFDTLGLDTLFADGPAPERLSRLVGGARVVSWFGSKDPGFTHRLRALAAGAVVASSVPAAPTPVWRHLLASVKTFVAGGHDEDAWRDPVRPSGDMTAAGSRALAGAGWAGVRPLLIVHPGAGGIGKRWPVEGFAEVVETIVDPLGAEVVVHEGPADREAAGALRSRLRVPAMTLAEPPLETLAGALSRAALWIGNDSGVSHLAAAVGAPTLALFAAANLAWRPWAPHAHFLVVNVRVSVRSEVDRIVAEAIRLMRTREPSTPDVRGAR